MRTHAYQRKDNPLLSASSRVPEPYPSSFCPRHIFPSLHLYPANGSRSARALSLRQLVPPQNRNRVGSDNQTDGSALIRIFGRERDTDICRAHSRWGLRGEDDTLARIQLRYEILFVVRHLRRAARHVDASY